MWCMDEIWFRYSYQLTEHIYKLSYVLFTQQRFVPVMQDRAILSWNTWVIRLILPFPCWGLGGLEPTAFCSYTHTSSYSISLMLGGTATSKLCHTGALPSLPLLLYMARAHVRRPKTNCPRWAADNPNLKDAEYLLALVHWSRKFPVNMCFVVQLYLA